jgi:plastocyanin
MQSKYLRTVSFLLVMLALGSIVVAACTRPGTTASGSSTPASSGSSTPTASSGSPTTPSNCAAGTAHTLVSSFEESCADVAKGGQLRIIPAVQSVHILDTGSWVNGNPVPMNEPGAPTLNNVQVTSSPVSIGPFNMAGTFHIYCTIHQNMNLTIVVQ